MRMAKGLIVYVFLLVLFPVCVKSSQILDQLSSVETNVLSCMMRVWNIYHDTYTLVISNNEQFYYDQETTVVLSSIDSFVTHSEFYRFNQFVLILEDTSNLNRTIDTIYNSVYWNSNALFLIAYLGGIEDLDEIFQTTWNYFTLHLTVLAQNETNHVNLYTFFPYKNGRCATYEYYEQISTCDTIEYDDIFPEKVPLQVNGCKIRMLAYWMPPYVIDLNAPREKSALAGIEVTSIHIISQRMNFTEVYLYNPYAHWGHKYDDGHYTFMYKELLDRKVDLIYGFTYGNSSYIFDFDTSYCYLDDRSVWIVPIALQMAQWKNLTAIFEWKLWLAIFLMLVINGIAWWFIGRKREESDEFNDLVVCLMHSLYTLLQGSVKAPSKSNLRMVFFLWLISGLLIFTAHQCQLISILTNPLYDRQISTLEEIVNSDLKFGFFPSLAEPYSTSNESIHKKVVRDYVQCPVTVECVNRTAFQRDFAVAKNSRQIRYLVPRYYTSSNGRKMVYETDSVLIHVKHRFHMIKGFPLGQRISFLQMLLESSGLIAKWDSDIQFMVLKIESEPDHEALSLNHLQGAFFIWVFGLLCSIIIFVFEIFSVYLRIYQNKFRQILYDYLNK